MPGSNLSGGFEIFLPKKRSSDLIVYRKVENPPVSE
jgi:hypothetical protein